MTVKLAYECNRKEEIAKIHNSFENGSSLQDDENDEEAAHVFEFIEIPSYIALISHNSTEPVYFLKVEAKGIGEKIMTNTYGHMLK